MFFETSIAESTTSYGDVAATKYEANLEGALMLVYENECNYNALVKAAALSELKYYKENGGDLFVQESGAFAGFINKAKEFFKKVIEKIKALFKKFVMTVTSFINSDKDWVKKYEKQIKQAGVYLDSDFSFKGYKFGDINAFINSNSFGNVTDAVAKKFDGGWKTERAYEDDDARNDAIEEKRAALVNISSNKVTEDELREEVKEALYGADGKIELESKDIDINKQLNFVRESAKDIKAAQNIERDAIRAIDSVIKFLDKKGDELANKISTDKSDAQNDRNKKFVKGINDSIKVDQALANSITLICGIVCQALKDRSRQAKAICIKAVGYGNKKKNESATVDSSDLFANVNII